ncbi:DUF488 domain-containing protein [Acetobacter orleanensis]|nr:DUF488 domain-containing protein [Acetobacter orleanensis]
MNTPHTFYTIGHSTHSLQDFIALLRHYGVTQIADVRAFPYSRRNRDFDGEALITELHTQGIGYTHIPELGGRRPRSKTVPVDTNAYWRVQSFHNYADYALGDDFHRGLEKLITMGRTETVALMCAEVLWWRCHRRIVTDYLLVNHQTVFHILSMTKAEKADLTPTAVETEQNRIVYPAAASDTLEN